MMIKNVSHWLGLAPFLGIFVLGSLSAHCCCLSGEHSDEFQAANAAAITVPAQNGYGPLAELIRMTGLMARANPFRFSTKYQDDESDLVYYGYRYYNPSAGRWLNRDPLEEKGGLNLLALRGNNAIDSVDPFGLDVPVVVRPPSDTLGGQVPVDLWTVVFWNGDIAKAPSWSGDTVADYDLRVTDVDFSASGSSCYCCKLRAAQTKIKITTTLNAFSTTFSPATLFHEGVHAWAFYQMGTYAFNTWIYQHKEHCLTLLDRWVPAGLNDVRRVPRTRSDCQAALQQKADALVRKIQQLADENKSDLGENIHSLLGTVGWTRAGESAVANWFWPWLDRTFPGGCLGDGEGTIDY